MTLGSSLNENKEFERYLKAFINLHDARERSDRGAYDLLLHDYVFPQNGFLIGSH